MNVAFIDLTFEHGADLVKTGNACRTGIQMESTPGCNALNEQDVAVATDKQIRRFSLKCGQDATGVFGRSTSDVRHPNTKPTCHKPLVFRPCASGGLVIDVPVHRTNRGDLGQRVSHREVPDVSCMPNFIASIHMAFDAVVNVTVGVGKQGNVHGCRSRLESRAQIRAKKLHFRSMKATWMFWGLVVALWGGMSAQMQAQTDPPSRKAQKEYQKALEAYRMRSPNLAITHLNAAIQRSEGFAEALFLKAQIFQEMAHPKQEEALVEALRADATMFPHGWVTLAQIQWELGKYEEGLQSLDRLDGLNSGNLSDEVQTRRNWVEAGLQFASDARNNPELVHEAKPTPGMLNTEALEYYGALDLTGTYMVLTRSGLPDDERRLTPGVAGGEDFFESFQSDDGTWSAPVPLPGVNTPMNEGAPTLSGDGKTMVFTACTTPRDGYGPRRGKGSCDLFESTWDETTKQWSLGVNLGAPNSAGWESQPALSADGNTLIFAKSPKAQKTPSNLVVCHRLGDGGWSSPRALPGLVNTPYTEESPFLHPDGKTLYFSSDGHPGFGQLDVFMSKLQEDGTWGAPVNLGSGVNSFGKDNSLMVLPRGGVAMFATTQGSGNLDFWQVELPEEVKPIEVATLRGVVRDAKVGMALNAEVVLVDLATGQTVSRTFSEGETGFVIPLPGLGSYSFEASAEGHLFGMTTYEQDGGTDLNRSPFVQIELMPIEVGQSFTLEAIQFESGLSKFSANYQAGCERLAKWMTENPEVRIRVVGHTDNVGSLPFNMALSEDRALAVRGFLTSKGIAEARINVFGEGPTKPIADNSTEEGRALNRRVEVLILD